MIDFFPLSQIYSFFQLVLSGYWKQNYGVTEIQTKLSATVIGQIFGPFMWEMWERIKGIPKDMFQLFGSTAGMMQNLIW